MLPRIWLSSICMTCCLVNSVDLMRILQLLKVGETVVMKLGTTFQLIGNQTTSNDFLLLLTASRIQERFMQRFNQWDIITKATIKTDKTNSTSLWSLNLLLKFINSMKLKTLILLQISLPWEALLVILAKKRSYWINFRGWKLQWLGWNVSISNNVMSSRNVTKSNKVAQLF